MRQISRNHFLLLMTCFSLGTSATLLAQSGSSKSGKSQVQPATSKTNTGAKAGVTNAASTDAGAKAASDGGSKDAGTKKAPAKSAEPIDSELEDLLKKWEASSAKIKTLHGEQTRHEFNPVFKVEKRSHGKFFLETPDKGRIDMLEVTFKKGDVSLKKDPITLIPYTLESGQSDRWICTGDAIVVIHNDAKTYEKTEIPEDHRGSNMVHSPLPFLFGMKADEAKLRFKMALMKFKDPKFVLISATPLLEKDQANYEQAQIYLDTSKYLPRRVRLIHDVDNGHETQYDFDEVHVNSNGVRAKLSAFFSGDSDPYHPSLKGYVLVQEPANDKPDPIDTKPAPPTNRPVAKPKGTQTGSKLKSSSNQ